MEADEVEVGRGQKTAEPDDEVQGVEQNRLRPIGPNAFHVVAHATILEDMHPVLSQRGPGDVLAKPLEPFTVATVEASSRVYAHPVAPDIGDLDGDGQLEILVQTFDHRLDVFRVPGSADNWVLWPTARGGPLRTGSRNQAP